MLVISFDSDNNNANPLDIMHKLQVTGGVTVKLYN